MVAADVRDTQGLFLSFFLFFNYTNIISAVVPVRRFTVSGTRYQGTASSLITVPQTMLEAMVGSVTAPLQSLITNYQAEASKTTTAAVDLAKEQVQLFQNENKVLFYLFFLFLLCLPVWTWTPRPRPPLTWFFFLSQVHHKRLGELRHELAAEYEAHMAAYKQSCDSQVLLLKEQLQEERKVNFLNL